MPTTATAATTTVATAGAAMEDVPFDSAPLVVPTYVSIVMREALDFHTPRLAVHGDAYTPAVRGRLEAIPRPSDAEYAAALEARARIEADVASLLARVDVLALPGMAITPPRLGQTHVPWPGGEELTRAAMLRLTQPFNLSRHAAIVMPDVDVEKVAEELFWAAFRNNGQICIATKRMYVHKDIYEPLKEALVAYAKTVKVRDGSEQGTQIGPINNEAQYRRVLDLIEDAKDRGYTFLVGGEAAEVPGYFIPVTILDNPPEDSRIVQEEQFGPVLPLLKFDDLDEVVARGEVAVQRADAHPGTPRDVLQ